MEPEAVNVGRRTHKIRQRPPPRLAIGPLGTAVSVGPKVSDALIVPRAPLVVIRERDPHAPPICSPTLMPPVDGLLRSPHASAPVRSPRRRLYARLRERPASAAATVGNCAQLQRRLAGSLPSHALSPAEHHLPRSIRPHGVPLLPPPPQPERARAERPEEDPSQYRVASCVAVLLRALLESKVAERFTSWSVWDCFRDLLRVLYAEWTEADDGVLQELSPQSLLQHLSRKYTYMDILQAGGADVRGSCKTNRMREMINSRAADVTAAVHQVFTVRFTNLVPVRVLAAACFRGWRRLLSHLRASRAATGRLCSLRRSVQLRRCLRIWREHVMEFRIAHVSEQDQAHVQTMQRRADREQQITVQLRSTLAKYDELSAQHIALAAKLQAMEESPCVIDLRKPLKGADGDIKHGVIEFRNISSREWDELRAELADDTAANTMSTAALTAQGLEPAVREMYLGHATRAIKQISDALCHPYLCPLERLLTAVGEKARRDFQTGAGNWGHYTVMGVREVSTLVEDDAARKGRGFINRREVLLSWSNSAIVNYFPHGELDILDYRIDDFTDRYRDGRAYLCLLHCTVPFGTAAEASIREIDALTKAARLERIGRVLEEIGLWNAAEATAMLQDDWGHDDHCLLLAQLYVFDSLNGKLRRVHSVTNATSQCSSLARSLFPAPPSLSSIRPDPVPSPLRRGSGHRAGDRAHRQSIKMLGMIAASGQPAPGSGASFVSASPATSAPGSPREEGAAGDRPPRLVFMPGVGMRIMAPRGVDRAVQAEGEVHHMLRNSSPADQSFDAVAAPGLSRRGSQRGVPGPRQSLRRASHAPGEAATSPRRGSRRRTSGGKGSPSDMPMSPSRRGSSPRSSSPRRKSRRRSHDTADAATQSDAVPVVVTPTPSPKAAPQPAGAVDTELLSWATGMLVWYQQHASAYAAADDVPLPTPEQICFGLVKAKDMGIPELTSFGQDVFGDSVVLARIATVLHPDSHSVRRVEEARALSAGAGNDPESRAARIARAVRLCRATSAGSGARALFSCTSPEAIADGEQSAVALAIAELHLSWRHQLKELERVQAANARRAAVEQFKEQQTEMQQSMQESAAEQHDARKRGITKLDPRHTADILIATVDRQKSEEVLEKDWEALYRVYRYYTLLDAEKGLCVSVAGFLAFCVDVGVADRRELDAPISPADGRRAPTRRRLSVPWSDGEAEDAPMESAPLSRSFLEKLFMRCNWPTEDADLDGSYNPPLGLVPTQFSEALVRLAVRWTEHSEQLRGQPPAARLDEFLSTRVLPCAVQSSIDSFRHLGADDRVRRCIAARRDVLLGIFNHFCGAHDDDESADQGAKASGALMTLLDFETFLRTFGYLGKGSLPRTTVLEVFAMVQSDDEDFTEPYMDFDEFTLCLTVLGLVLRPHPWIPDHVRVGQLVTQMIDTWAESKGSLPRKMSLSTGAGYQRAEQPQNAQTRRRSQRFSLGAAFPTSPVSPQSSSGARFSPSSGILRKTSAVTPANA